LNAVRYGEISESQIDQSVLKILRAKASVGLNKARLVDINAVNQIVAKPESLQAAQWIADKSVTLVRDNGQVLPLKRARPAGTNPAIAAYHPVGESQTHTLLLIFSDDSRSDSGRLFDQQLRRRIPDSRVLYVDMRTASGITPAVLSVVEQADRVIAAVY